MKFTHAVMMVAVVAAMMFVAGCTSEQPADPDAAMKASIAAKQAAEFAKNKAIADVVNNPYVFSHSGSSGKYGQAEVTGVIYNPYDNMVKVFGYVDYYQNGVKVDDGIFSCTPDAHGKASFKSSSFDTKGKYTYEIRITNVYKA